MQMRDVTPVKITFDRGSCSGGHWCDSADLLFFTEFGRCVSCFIFGNFHCGHLLDFLSHV